MESSGGSTRLPLIAQLYPQKLVDLLNALGDPAAMLRGSLRLAMCISGADRGLAFEDVGVLASIGFGAAHAWFLRSRLSALSPRGSLAAFGSRDFTEPRKSGTPACGMAGVIPIRTAICVIAVERDDGLLTLDRQADMLELIGFLRRPLEQTAELQRLKQEKPVAGEKIQIRALPLHRLLVLPQLEELELMLIEEALHRCKGNKTRAAAVLGVTREGLRRKILRLNQKTQLASSGS